MLSTVRQKFIFCNPPTKLPIKSLPYTKEIHSTLLRPSCPCLCYRKINTLEFFGSTVEYFLTWYNSAHLHSGIKFVTPNIRHNEHDIKVLQKRELVYQKAREKYPARWKTKLKNRSPIEKVHFNPTRKEKLKKIA